uniref:Large subunit GTPase 1 homolog n=1 Tax=Arion vulgaris TaxID=1028688 RepID=A0A0B7B2U5_9EUPU
MGKRKGQIAKMGRSLLVRDINKKQGHRKDANSFLHTTELDDGTTYNRINFQSVTEQNNLEDFLTTAEMAGKDFTAERENIQIISQPGLGVRLTDADMQKISQAQDANRAMLQIPRRPKWNESTTKEDLALLERDSFTDWRRQLKQLEEKEHIQLTPYEKNLDFWRQLWRVIERSDVIVQIVDARNPLLFRCVDLEFCVKEVDPKKTVMILANKADFLTQHQRQQWVEYFNKEGIRVVFFSAKVEKERQEEFSDATSDDIQEEDESDIESDSDDDADEDSDDDDVDEDSKDEDVDNDEMSCDNDEKINSNKTEIKICEDANTVTTVKNLSPAAECGGSSLVVENETLMDLDANVSNSPEIVSAEELLDIFRKLAHPSSCARLADVKTVGMVGYPNVGKSSTINVILKEKKLPVSATPGRTKHLQTLFVDEHLVLCDCPGLVFPSFVATKAHLVINGILPIDEMRDHVSPTNLVCELIPRNVVEATYSIMIPRPSLDDTVDRIPTSEELLNAYGAMRGFMNARGVPDGPRSARYILKDFVKGKLLYCEPPPGIAAAEFQDQERISVLEGLRPISKIPPPRIRSDVDKEFFAQRLSKIHHKGKGGLSDVVGASSIQNSSRTSEASASGAGILGSTTSINSLSNKPWKKHNNRNKKEKLRRLHRDLDV